MESDDATVEIALVNEHAHEDDSKSSKAKEFFLLQAQKLKNHWMDILLIIFYMICSVTFEICNKNVSYRMANYTWTLSLIQPMFMIPAVLILQVVRYLCCVKIVAPSWRLVTWVLLIALLLAIWTVMMKYGYRGNYVSGPVGEIVSQTGILYTLILSILFLGWKLNWKHFVAAILVIAAVVVISIPQIESGMSVQDALALIMLIVSPIPTSFASIVNEHVLRDIECDYFWIVLLTLTFQSIFNLPLLLLIPSIQDVPFANITSNARDGFLCFFSG